MLLLSAVSCASSYKTTLIQSDDISLGASCCEIMPVQTLIFCREFVKTLARVYILKSELYYFWPASSEYHTPSLCKEVSKSILFNFDLDWIFLNKMVVASLLPL